MNCVVPSQAHVQYRSLPDARLTSPAGENGNTGKQTGQEDSECEPSKKSPLEVTGGPPRSGQSSRGNTRGPAPKWVLTETALAAAMSAFRKPERSGSPLPRRSFLQTALSLCTRRSLPPNKGVGELQQADSAEHRGHF